MNVTDTELENKRKQAINDLVADSTTLAERLLKAGDFELICYHLRHHALLAQAVVKLLPRDRFEVALRAVIRRELVDILGQAAKGG